jgi:phosphomannomutase
MSKTTETEIVFGKNGWQGIIADDFTFENVWQVTRAIALYLETTHTQDRPVLIGYDTRFLADRFAYSAAEILTDFGRTVKIVDRDCPTSVIIERVRAIDSACALMFTAGSKPAKYCGIKYIPDDTATATTDITARIAANLDKADNLPPSGKNTQKILYFDPKPEYLKSIYNLLSIDTLRGAALKVKYDSLYSTARGYLDAICDYCHVELESFNTKRDVLFGGGLSEMTDKYLQQLIESVREDKADLGVAIGGDGCQLATVDDRGRILTDHEILLILADRLKGESFDSENILERDGILASILVAETIAIKGKPLSQLVEEATVKLS